MGVKINNIAKNTSYLTTALVLQKIISLTYFTLLARNLGAANLGKYYFAISFVTIFAIFIDLGLVNVITRELAKKKEDAQHFIGNIISIKLPLVVLTVIAAIVTINLLDYPQITIQLVYLASICMVADSFTNTFYGIARAHHNLLFESIGSVVFQIIVLALGLTAVYSGFNLLWVMAALVTASLFNFFFSLGVVWKKIGVKIKPVFDKQKSFSIIQLTVPFGLFALFQRFYMHFDSVLLSLMAGDKYVGYYQIAFKIVFALQFLPMAFVASLYPAMSNYWLNNREQLSITFERAIKYLMIISIPISAGVVALADKIILIFKNDFLNAVLPMQIIIISLLFIFINFPIGSLLNACDRQKQNTANMVIATILSIILNLILIPRFQAVGASITVLATNALITVLGFYWASKTIYYRFRRIGWIFLKCFTAAILMGLAVFYLKTSLNILFVVIIGAFIYFMLLFVFKGYGKEDVMSIYEAVDPRFKKGNN